MITKKKRWIIFIVLSSCIVVGGIQSFISNKNQPLLISPMYTLPENFDERKWANYLTQSVSGGGFQLALNGKYGKTTNTRLYPHSFDPHVNTAWISITSDLSSNQIEAGEKMIFYNVSLDKAFIFDWTPTPRHLYYYFQVPEEVPLRNLSMYDGPFYRFYIVDAQSFLKLIGKSKVEEIRQKDVRSFNFLNSAN